MKWAGFYRTFFPEMRENLRKPNVICPFHADEEPSLSLDLEEGLWYCHSCQLGGDVFSFHMKYHSCSFTSAKNAILGNQKVQVLTPTEVEVAHEKLKSSEQLRKLLFIKRGWTDETINNFKLGWMDERVYIPVYEKSKLVNIRKYDLLHKSKEKFLGVTGCNKIRLFPEQNLVHNRVIVFAGEPDTLLASQLGFPAVTFTGGEGTFRAELLPEFKDKIVYICYDIDEAGRKASANLAKRITEYAKETYVIDLPSSILPSNGDFTDLYMWSIDNDRDFETVWNPLITSAIKYDPDRAPVFVDYKETDFYNAVKEEYYNQDVAFKAIAIGKNFSPFYAPKKISVSCEFTRGDSCKACKLFVTGGSYVLEVKDNDAMNLIKCSQGEQRHKIKELIGITGCNQFKMEMEIQTIEEIFIAPIIDSERIDRQFLIRKTYTKSYNLQLNKTYRFMGKTIPDAKTQEATHLFGQQIPELTDLDIFQLSEEDKIKLRIFNPAFDTLEGVELKIGEICKDIAYNIPEIIVGRENLIFAYDLVFHSVLKFNFLNSVVSKGWVELLALGDTRTGKTKTAIKLCQHYKVGEYITLESATLPGLVGGISQVGKDVTFSWGVLPINDGRLVVLDEVNGLDVNAISNLSSIRDNGIAERTVVGSTRKTSARVRAIWISNPRSTGLRVSHYSSGVEAIRELMGRSEDISRLDFAIIVAKEDVDVNFINKLSYNKPMHKYTQELCNKCLMWAWSRKEKDVIFEDAAEKLILKYAIAMSEKYSDTIPLVQGSVQRIKLAKLSVSLACRLFSSDNGERVIVKVAHVEYINQFLNELYDGVYFGYKDYSVNKKEQDVVTEESKIKQTLHDIIDKEKFINKMLGTNTILFEDIVDFSGKTKETARDFKSFLVSHNCLTRRKTWYIKTPEFIKILKRTLAEIREEAPF